MKPNKRESTQNNCEHQFTEDSLNCLRCGESRIAFTESKKRESTQSWKKRFKNKFGTDVWLGADRETVLNFIQEEIKNAKEDGYQKGTNFMQDYADQAYRQAREEVIEQTRQGILKDLHQLRWAIDTKPFKVFKEDFIDFVNEIDNLKL